MRGSWVPEDFRKFPEEDSGRHVAIDVAIDVDTDVATNAASDFATRKGGLEGRPGRSAFQVGLEGRPGKLV